MALGLDSTDLAETGLHAAHRGLPPSDRASGGRAPAVVPRNLGISLVTLEKHYAAALQKGRAIALEDAARTTRKLHGPFLLAQVSKSVPDGI